jgi:hypothetical protein
MMQIVQSAILFFLFLSFIIITTISDNVNCRVIGSRVCAHLPYDFYNVPGERHYFFLRYEHMTFIEARNFCLSQDMDLPPILNQNQNNLITCNFSLNLYFNFLNVSTKKN